MIMFHSKLYHSHIALVNTRIIGIIVNTQEHMVNLKGYLCYYLNSLLYI